MYSYGDPVIDIGGYGKLIMPVRVDGKFYYYWDRSGGGPFADSGPLNGGADYVTHSVLDCIFSNDINGVPNTKVANVDGAYGTTHVYRYAILNGIHLALPKTSDLLAIWNAHMGIGNCVLPGWPSYLYWSATPFALGYAYVNFVTGTVAGYNEYGTFYVALQVL